MPIDSQVEVKQVRIVKGTGAQIEAARQAQEILETDLVVQTDAPELVPETRTINNKPLSSDIQLTASDVGAVSANTAISGATKCKITYDSKGLVTAGDDLGSSDITTALGYTPYNSTNPNGYQTAEQVSSAVSVETTNRENADIGLQNQIDAITASSDVKDIVGTYAQLQAYDTSTLGNNDIIKVLQDETHSDETTYYRWSTTTETFTLIGEEGPYYTKSEADSTFVPKTRTVNGKSLSSDISLTASDVGALPDSTTIGNATLTIQKNGTTIDTFTANATSDKTINVTVPTDTNDLSNGAGYITGITSSDVTTALGYTPPTINSSNNYVPYRSSATAFSNSTLMYNSSAMAFTGKLHVGSTSPSTYSNFGRFTIYDKTPSQQVTSMALLNYGGGGGCGVAIDMYNTNANSGIPSGRFGLIDNGNYSGYLQLKVKKSGASNNPLLPAMNIVPVPATSSLTTCVSFGKDEFNNALFDLHKPEEICSMTDSDKRWSGSGTTYSQNGSNKFNSRLMVAVGDIVYFTAGTEATVISIVSNTSTHQITVDRTLGNINDQRLYVKKAYFKVTDENYNTKIIINPYGKMGLGTSAPAYDLDVNGNINASTDVKVNGNSIVPNNPTITITQGGTTKGSFTLNQSTGDTIELDAGANTDLSNLTSTGKNIGNWSSNVTNCITEIPQDIKLELNNGTLTLKSGSVITAPDGTQRVTTQDQTTSINTDGKYILFVDSSSGLFQLNAKHTLDKIGSGSSLPADGSTYRFFLNTSDQKIYRWIVDSASWSVWSVALPIGIITASNGAISSIDQVFNGFGYFGSTVFALPDVKGLISNGRNADGSLKNIEFTTNSVLTVNVSGSVNNYSIVLNGSALYALSVYQEVDKPVSGYVNYIESENYIYNGLNQRSWAFVGSYNTSSGKITSLTPKTVFHALDYNNKGTIAGWAMPSNKYIGLTLGASGSTYTAPANGYFIIDKATTGAQYVSLYNDTNNVSLDGRATENGQTIRLFVPVKKGDTVYCYYSAGGTTNYFRFVYAEGEQ